MFITNKNITESLVRSLQNSFQTQTNCEIILMCEGKTIKCHRHVLVLHSSHFANLFKEQSDFPSAIAVVNMKFTHLKAMVDYMYFGRIKLQEDTDEMKQIIKCAEDLGLSALVTFITEYLKSVSRHKSLNGSANISNNDLNGDDSLMKRKRASDIASRLNNDSFKKPKLNEGSNSTSTPSRDSKSSTKSSITSDVKSVASDNSETLTIDKKVKSGDEEADDEDNRRRIKEEEAEKVRKVKEEVERKRKDEEERKRREEEKQRLEEERRKKEEEEKRKAAEELKRKAAEELKRKAEEAERNRIEEEKKKKASESKKEEEARKAEEERNKKETKCDESASTKSCAVCNKQYKDNIDHRKVLEGVTFDKKCIMTGCSKPLPFRRALIDHLLKAHKIDVCDG